MRQRNDRLSSINFNLTSAARQDTIAIGAPVKVSATFVTSPNAFYYYLNWKTNDCYSITVLLLHLQTMDTKIRVLQSGSWQQSCRHFLTRWHGGRSACQPLRSPRSSPAGHSQFCRVPFKGNEAAETGISSEWQLILLLSGRHRDLLSPLPAGCYTDFELFI